MAFCPNCGNNMADGFNICSRCGTPLNNTPPAYQPQQNYQAPPVNQGYQAPPVNQSYQAPPVNQGYQAPPVNQSYQAPPVNQGYQAPPMNQGYQAPPVYQPQQGYPMQQPKKSSPAAIILGIIGIISSWLIALVGHITSIIGIVLGIKEYRETKSMAGLVLSIIGEVCAIISSIIGAVLLTSATYYL